MFHWSEKLWVFENGNGNGKKIKKTKVKRAKKEENEINKQTIHSHTHFVKSKKANDSMQMNNFLLIISTFIIHRRTETATDSICLYLFIEKLMVLPHRAQKTMLFLLYHGLKKSWREIDWSFSAPTKAHFNLNTFNLSVNLKKIPID